VKKAQFLFIHDVKEVFVLTLLSLMVALFTFTLGVHLGKRVGGKSVAGSADETVKVKTVADIVPNRQELNEQNEGTPRALEEVLSEALQNEVSRTGLKIAVQHQVDLPKNAQSHNAGATTLEATRKVKHPVKNPGEAKNSDSKYTLQIGSFPTLEEAKKQISAMAQNDLSPFMREAEVKGKGKWYRLYLGGYPNKNAAEQAGEKYRSQRKIASFIVSNLTLP
jgi:cell division protein FtsN